MTLASTPGAAPYGRSELLPDANEPPVPETVRDTGLSEEFIVDLLLKTLYVQGARTRWHKAARDALELPAGTLVASGTAIGDTIVLDGG